MPDLIFAATSITFTRARLCADYVLFQVVQSTTKQGRVLSEIRVDYATLGTVVALAERLQSPQAPVLAKLLRAQQTQECC